jgi:uncharacterized protein (TIGR03546 family)
MLMFVHILLAPIRFLREESCTTALAAGMTFGLFLGWAPTYSLQFMAAFMVVLLFRINALAALMGWAVFGTLAALFSGPLDALGQTLLETESLRGLWTFFYNSSFHYCHLHNSLALGQTVVALALTLPGFFLFRFMIRLWRYRVEAAVMESRAVQAMGATWLYRAFRWGI